jgi:hypothetical protein
MKDGISTPSRHRSIADELQLLNFQRLTLQPREWGGASPARKKPKVSENAPFGSAAPAWAGRRQPAPLGTPPVAKLPNPGCGYGAADVPVSVAVWKAWVTLEPWSQASGASPRPAGPTDPELTKRQAGR